MTRLSRWPRGRRLTIRRGQLWLRAGLSTRSVAPRIPHHITPTSHQHPTPYIASHSHPTTSLSRRIAHPTPPHSTSLPREPSQDYVDTAVALATRPAAHAAARAAVARGSVAGEGASPLFDTGCALGGGFLSARGVSTGFFPTREGWRRRGVCRRRIRQWHGGLVVCL